MSKTDMAHSKTAKTHMVLTEMATTNMARSEMAQLAQNMRHVPKGTRNYDIY